MATIEDLCPELLVEIFSHYVRSEGHLKFLRNISKVCQAWENLKSEAALWKKVEARNWNNFLYFSQKGLLYHTQNLELCYHYSFTDKNISAVIKNIRDLKALDFYNETTSDVIKLVTEYFPHLEHLTSNIHHPSSTTPYDLDQFLTVCGRTLKYLDLQYCCSREEGQQLLSGIAATCPLLEKLRFYPGKESDVPFRIYDLGSGCPRLKELEFWFCRLITDGRNDSLGCELKTFRASFSDLSGLDVYRLLKDSIDLEELQLFDNTNFVYDNISKIPSDKVRILNIYLMDPKNYLKALGDAVWKWRHTLSVLCLQSSKYHECDINCVLERLLHENPKPQLEKLEISHNNIDHSFEEFVQKCQKLIYLRIGGKNCYIGREEIERSFGISREKGRALTQNSWDLDRAE